MRADRLDWPALLRPGPPSPTTLNFPSGGWEPNSHARGTPSKGRAHDDASPRPQKPQAQPYTPQPLEATVSISRCSKFRLQKQLLSQTTSPLLRTGPSTRNHKPQEEEERGVG